MARLVFTADTSQLLSELKKSQAALGTLQSEYKLAASEAELLAEKEERLKAKMQAATTVKEKQQAITEKYRTALDKVQKEVQEYRTKNETLTRSLKEATEAKEQDVDEIERLKKALDENTKTLIKAETEQEKLTKQYNNAQTAVNKTEKSYQKLENQLKTLNNETAATEQAAGQGADGLNKMGDGADNMSVNVVSAQDAISSLSNMLSSLYSSLDSVTNKFEQFAINGIKKALDGMKKLAEFSFDAGSSYEYAMDQVAATMRMDESDPRYQALSDMAKKMGAETKYTATEAAEGLNILAQSGLTAEEQISALPDVLNMAIAGTLSLEDSSSYLTAAVKGYGDEMKNMGKYADLISAGASLANTNVAGLGAAFSSASSSAKSYGQDAEDLTISLLRLAEQNVTSEEAATALNRAMMDLYTPTEQTAKAMAKIGLKAYDSSGNAREFNEIIDELNGKLSKMSEEEANVLKNNLFTTYGLQAFNKMTATSTDKVEEFREALQNADGAAQEMSETMSDNLKGSMDGLNSAAEGFGIAIYEKLSPNVKKVVDALTGFIREQIGSIDNGYFGMAFDKIGDAIGRFAEKLPAILEKNEGRIRILANQVGELIAVFIDSLPYILEDALPKLINFISEILEGLPEFFEDTIPKIVDFAMFLINNLPTILTTLYGLQGLSGLLTTVAQIAMIGMSFKTLMGGGGKLATMLGSLGGKFAALGGKILAVGAGPIAAIVAAIAALVAIFVVAWKKSETFRQTIENIGNLLKNAFGRIIETTKDAFSGLAEKFEGLNINGEWLITVCEVIATILSGIVAEALIIVANLVEGAIKLIGGFVDLLIGLFDIIKSFFTGDWEGVKDAAKRIGQSVVDIVKAPFDTIKNFTKDTADLVKGTLDGMAGKASDTAASVKSSIDKIKDYTSQELNLVAGGNYGLSSATKTFSNVNSTLSVVQNTPSAVLNPNYVTNNITLIAPDAISERKVYKSINNATEAALAK